MSEAKESPNEDGNKSEDPSETFTVRDLLEELLPYKFEYDPTIAVYGMDRIPNHFHSLLEAPLEVSRIGRDRVSPKCDEMMPTKKSSFLSSAISCLTGKKSQKNKKSNKQTAFGKNAKKRGGGIGKGKADDDDDPYAKITLEDVGGLDEQVEWLQDAVLSHLTGGLRLRDFGVTPPRGILLYGPPGTGKTLLARAFGNELSKLTGNKVSFFHQRGPECYTPTFGESEDMLRDLFAEAEKSKPSIIFFDELDGLCPSRKGSIGEAATSVVTILLGCMDNLPVGEVFVFGATNLIDSVDPAMIRPGRFDKHLEFFPPSFEGRRKIIEIHTKKWKRSQPTGAKLDEMTAKTQGFTGADLEMLARQAVTSAMERTVPSLENFNDKAKKDLDKMMVTDKDWAKAFKLVKPSPPAYNSPAYFPVLPHPCVNPLVKQSQDFILYTLRLQLPKDTVASEENKGTGASSLYEVNSLLIVGEEEDNLERYVLPGVFAHSEVSKIPTYTLSSLRLQTDSRGPLDCLTHTIRTVLNCGKPCILYIQMIDVIVYEEPVLLQDLAYNLQLLKGKDVLLLATSTKDWIELPTDFNFRSLFSKMTICSVTPLQSETEVFLGLIFREVMEKMERSAQGKKKACEFIQQATIKLKDATILEHLNFVDNLLESIKDEKKSQKIPEKLMNSVTEFQFRDSLLYDP